MSGPIIRDNLYVVLNNSNNWTYQGQLSAPIINVSKCRILSNQNAIVTTNFLRDSYLMDGTNPVAQKVPGLVYVGDDKSWFDVKDSSIQRPSVNLYSSVSFDSLCLNFQFI